MFSRHLSNYLLEKYISYRFLLGKENEQLSRGKCKATYEKKNEAVNLWGATLKMTSKLHQN